MSTCNKRGKNLFFLFCAVSLNDIGKCGVAWSPITCGSYRFSSFAKGSICVPPSIYTNLSDNRLAAFHYHSYTQYAPRGLRFFFFICSRNFSCLFLVLNICVLFVVIFFKTPLLLPRSMSIFLYNHMSSISIF